jgi:hypothetical protein
VWALPVVLSALLAESGLGQSASRLSFGAHPRASIDEIDLPAGLLAVTSRAESVWDVGWALDTINDEEHGLFMAVRERERHELGRVGGGPIASRTSPFGAAPRASVSSTADAVHWLGMSRLSAGQPELRVMIRGSIDAFSWCINNADLPSAARYTAVLRLSDLDLQDVSPDRVAALVVTASVDDCAAVRGLAIQLAAKHLDTDRLVHVYVSRLADPCPDVAHEAATRLADLFDLRGGWPYVRGPRVIGAGRPSITRGVRLVRTTLEARRPDWFAD